MNTTTYGLSNAWIACLQATQDGKDAWLVRSDGKGGKVIDRLSFASERGYELTKNAATIGPTSDGKGRIVGLGIKRDRSTTYSDAGQLRQVLEADYEGWTDRKESFNIPAIAWNV